VNLYKTIKEEVMKSKKFIFIIIFLATLPSVLFAKSNHIVYASSSQVTTWDPSVSYSTELVYMPNLYETLIRIAPPGSGKRYDYVLANNYKVSKNGLRYVFELKQDVKFHDGITFDANAVKFSIERTLKIGEGASFIWADVKSINVLDKYSVEILLITPVPLPEIAASAYAAWMISPGVKDKRQEWFDVGNCAGTGPYILKNYKAGESWMLSKNPNYWGGWKNKHIENILVKYTKDTILQQPMLQSGQAHIVTRVSPNAYKTLESDDRTQIIRGPSHKNYMAFFNTKKAPLNDVRIRKALAHAIPYQAIIDIAFAGAATQARGVIPNGQFGFSKSVKQHSYDLEKAKKYLSQAGYANGGFKLTMTYAASNTMEQTIASLIQVSYKQLGIEVKIIPLPWKTQWEKAKNGYKQAQDIFLLLWWPTYSDPYETLYSIHHNETNKPVWNLAYYANKKFDKIIREAYEMAGSKPQKARQLYIDAQNMIFKDAPVAYIADTIQISAISSKLKGHIINPAYNGSPFFYKMWLTD
jgi:peptide/nickel transport system substrate-binding protein